MLKSIKATVEMNGDVHLQEPIRVNFPCRAIVTILDEPDISETTLLSETALTYDWERPEEDEAWSHLQ